MASSSLWPSMYQLIKRHPKAVAASVGLHVVLLTLLSLSLTSSEIPDQPEPQASTIKAVLVDANKIDDERKKRVGSQSDDQAQDNPNADNQDE